MSALWERPAFDMLILDERAGAGASGEDLLSSGLVSVDLTMRVDSLLEVRLRIS